MTQKITHVKRALLSVSDKTGIIEFAKALVSLGIEIISTGGTYKVLQEANIPAREVSEITGFPEIMSGRVKTLHPKIHGGILGLRDQHAEVAKNQDIDWIDLVVVNLYPFFDKMNTGLTEAEMIEFIDIGGPSMLRSSAKNFYDVTVITEVEDYEKVKQEIEAEGQTTLETRRLLAGKAFLAMITIGVAAISPMGAKSLAGSYFRLGYCAGAAPWVPI